MSIADKLTAVAENQQKVYDAGVAAGRRFVTDESKAVEKTVTGNTEVSVSDVSELPHKCSVRLSGGPADCSGVILRRVGKNLFDNVWEMGGISTVSGGNINDSKSIRSGYIPIAPNRAYYFALRSGNLYPVLYDKEKKFTRYAGLRTGSFSFTAAADECYLRVYYFNSTQIPEQPQLELGSAATAYEPYSAAAYTPTPEGVVEDIDSLCPNMTVFADTTVDIALTYHQYPGLV